MTGRRAHGALAIGVLVTVTSLWSVGGVRAETNDHIYNNSGTTGFCGPNFVYHIGTLAWSTIFPRPRTVGIVPRNQAGGRWYVDETGDVTLNGNWYAVATIRCQDALNNDRVWRLTFVNGT